MADDADSVLATETVATGKDGDATGLTVVCHPDPAVLGASVRLQAGMSLALGRKATDLGPGVLADNSVSRDHATVRVSAQRDVEVADAGSHNGTLVNGTKITTTTLRPGDVLRLGRIALFVDDDPPEGERVEALPGFAGFSRTWQRLTRVASVLTSRTTPVLIWGPEGSGCRALAQAIAEPGPVHILRTPAEAWPQEGTAIVTQLDRWPEEALGSLGEPDGARAIVVSHRAPELLTRLPEAFREAVVPWTLTVPPLASRRVDVAAIAWELCPRFGGPDARPTPELIERLLRMPLALHARRLEAIVERAAIESAGSEIDVFTGLDTHRDPTPAAGDPVGALRKLGSAFWLPVTDRYAAEDAATAHAVVVFLEQVLREMNLQPEPLTQTVREALDRVRHQGGEVHSAITSRLEQFMSELAGADSSAVIEALVSRAGAMAPADGADRMSSMTAAESAVINEVGGCLLRRAYPEALQTIDAHLPRASVALRAALLGQRGAVLHMTRDLSGARACYVEAAQLEPDNPHYLLVERRRGRGAGRGTRCGGRCGSSRVAAARRRAHATRGRGDARTPQRVSVRACRRAGSP